MTKMPRLLHDQRRRIVLQSEIDEYGMTMYNERECAPEFPERVYFIRCGDDGPIKIGRSTDPLARLKGLQTGCPYKLHIIATIRGGDELEQTLHNQFKDHRIRGEWFRPVPELLGVIEAINSA